MTPDEARTVIRDAINAIAPEIDLDRIDRSRVLTDQVELDSMDQLNVMIHVSRVAGIDISERDYPLVRSLDDFTSYLVRRTEPTAGVRP